MTTALFFRTLVSCLVLLFFIGIFTPPNIESIPERYRKLIKSAFLLFAAIAIFSILGIVWTI